MKKIRRWKYLDKIYKALEKEKLVLLLWPIQVGKTTLLLTIKEETNLPVYYYSFEDEFSRLEFKNKLDFINFFQTTLNVDFYSDGLFLLDEFQYVKQNTKILKSLYDDKEIKIKFIVTCSWIWSMKEDQSSLVGRWEEIFVWGFDFFEFLETKWLNLKDFKIENYTFSLENVFFDYYKEFIKYGAYPAVVLAKSQEEKILNLQKIIQKYIEKDVWFFLLGQELIDFKKFFIYLTWWIWNLVKVEAISDYLWIKVNTVKKFLNILDKTLFIHFVYPFFTDKSKEYTKHPKIYFHDIGVINFLNKNFNNLDYCKLNENMIFTELLKNKLFNSDEIKIYKKISKSEIDFIYDGLTRFVPIEVKSNNSIQIPKIFYSFEKQYWEKVNFYVRTTQNKLEIKNLDSKKIYFIPNYLVGKIF